MRVELYRPVAAGERLSADAFKNQIGKRISLRAGIRAAVPAGVLVAAKVVDGGTAAVLTIETDVSLDEVAGGEV